jgi:2-polyprenyl-3-methyl-5-hydroxy-6-metoxy-1,4-benzoquinol methylase
MIGGKDPCIVAWAQGWIMNDRDATRRFYDAVAERSYNDWFHNPALLPTLTAFMCHLPKQPLVLDLGCGTGGESRRLSELGASVIGIDFSEESIRYAASGAPEIRFLVTGIGFTDFQRHEFRIGSFQCVEFTK